MFNGGFKGKPNITSASFISGKYTKKEHHLLKNNNEWRLPGYNLIEYLVIGAGGGGGETIGGGGGGGGAHYNATNKGGDGGSGIVIIRYKYT